MWHVNDRTSDQMFGAQRHEEVVLLVRVLLAAFTLILVGSCLAMSMPA
jgi:hypothetical protein